MHEPDCPPHEDIIRAITTAHIVNGEITSALFVDRRADVSVNRLAIMDFNETLKVLHHNLEQGEEKVLGVGVINIGKMIEIGRGSGKELNVRPDPLDADPSRNMIANPGHACIPHRINRTLAHEIIKELKKKWDNQDYYRHSL